LREVGKFINHGLRRVLEGFRVVVWDFSHQQYQMLKEFLDGWWFFTNPSEKYGTVKMGIFPQVGVKIKNPAVTS